MSDQKGLYLEIAPSGSKYWRLKYRFLGKEKRLALGVYPERSLADARKKAAVARSLLDQGVDPSQYRKEEKRAAKLAASNSFEAVAREWHGVKAKGWAPGHAERVLASLEADVFPTLGRRPVSEIKASECLDLIRSIEKRGVVDTASRIRQRLSAVFCYAIACDKAENDPAAVVRGALSVRKTESHKMLPRADLPQFLSTLKDYSGDPLTRLALEFLVLTFTRTREVRGARWDEIDTHSKNWLIPEHRMKAGLPHIVPLSEQALTLIDEVRRHSGKREFLFPGRDPRKPMSENTMLFALYRLGYHSRATVHGFRALASSVLNESGLWSPDAVERQLAHSETDEIRKAYNRAEYLDERTRMMQWWAAFLDAERARRGRENIITFRAAGASNG